VSLLNDKRHPAVFFLEERESVVRGLLNLRCQLCGYGAHGACDCKYGVRDKAHPTSEQNGCPEALAAATILSTMTDAEYLEFAKRAGCFHT